MTYPCPHCGEPYEVVEVEAGPETRAREITCLACGGPLQGRRGRYIRKYFRLKKGPQREHPPKPLALGERTD
jgi:hypothetical protein